MSGLWKVVGIKTHHSPTNFAGYGTTLYLTRIRQVNQKKLQIVSRHHFFAQQKRSPPNGGPRETLRHSAGKSLQTITSFNAGWTHFMHFYAVFQWRHIRYGCQRLTRFYDRPEIALDVISGRNDVRGATYQHIFTRLAHAVSDRPQINRLL